ncbi:MULTISPECIES: FliM/FliN family flagellar motor switch protein [Rhodobacterales]|jgi:flagellar motor switch/type III secretory pathway protein FliN|uniref:FliM/FliN family flagellar motor switch protein n=1 Tax=Rhodobacterales TaxID=204455 RepID=UPI00237F4D82|nr:FliM/FliN family flagellar motor C-terminal domain-containing protein [Phaeobacter gallaeciensis]MDE4099036.1 FliM/FliN family flagellar motor C-terminal domain-containing protein [Phaeobacter gallaeciensis]MDE4107846.1 FliM/FliN family flagellar motor C-terminal domain-containing protein [Phaeobacter gallaeciensis]MDE4112300.1 FliM/FliN family flagellar motor C-terminal domain-containing protein [Phaeobacter gallaeciensis]MDE4116772.1 FliM/FliN family flagellar motor C-terminal domain-conta
MSDTTTQDSTGSKPGVLARKLAATKEGSGAFSSSLTLKALRRSLARAAAELCELPLAVLAARQVNRASDELPEMLSDKHLLVVLDGPDGRLGAATMDAALVTALIQKQTIGQVMGKTPTERHYTPTDAAMTADFLESALKKVVVMLEGQSDQAIFSGYQFGAQVEDLRSLALGLEADDYRVLTLTVDLAIGAMQGELNLILPEPTPEELGKGGGSGPSLGRNLGAMRAELSAVLCKMRVPLNEFSGLKTGDLLPLDQAFLYETDLQAVSGQSIAQGRLGQLNGARAVRLNQPRTKLVNDMEADQAGFADGVGADAMPAAADEMPTLDLGIAAEDLQDPLDSGMGGGGLGSGLGGDFDTGGLGDMTNLGGDLGSDMGGDLGADLENDFAAALGGGDLGGNFGGDLGGGLGGDLPALPDTGMDEFNPDDAAAEISKLAGLGSG